MNEEEMEFIINLIYRLRRMDLDYYQRTKHILLCKVMADADLPLVDFLKDVFDYVESCRPLLIEMKCDGVELRKDNN